MRLQTKRTGCPFKLADGRLKSHFRRIRSLVGAPFEIADLKHFTVRNLLLVLSAITLLVCLNQDAGMPVVVGG